jgi:Leucine-rich repeat (LRR) protein
MNSPFKFLDPYESKDVDAFFGRSDETKELFSLVNKNRLTFVYGPSGSGKTSLVQCGLAGCFNGIDWLPLFIRRGDNINSSLRATIGRVLGESFAYEGELATAVRTLFKRHLRTIYLIFDQFEELYILGTKNEDDERIPFYKTIADLLEADLPCRLLFIMREDYFGHLNRFERLVPDLYHRKLRVEPMSRENLHKVIVGSCKIYGITFGDPEKDPIRILDHLTLDHSAVQMTFVQIYLHTLYLSAVKEQEVAEGETTPISFNRKVIEKMGLIEDVLRNFLQDREKDIWRQLIEDHHPSQDFVSRVLDIFVTEEGTRLPVSFQQNDNGDYLLLGRHVNHFVNQDRILFSTVIEELLRFRILRRSQGELELAHDTLAALIDQRRTAEYRQLKEIHRRIEVAYKEHIESEGEHFLDEGQLRRIEAFIDLENNDLPLLWVQFINESREKVEAKEQRQKKLEQSEKKLEIEKKLSETRKKQVIVVGGLSILLFLASVFAFQQSKKFQSQKKIADELAQLAKAQENKTQAVLDKIYFYEDQFGLAFDPDLNAYGFIDKALNTKIAFDYDEALPFDYTGFAKVKKGRENLLVNTSGTTYHLAGLDSQLHTGATALELRGRDLNQLPPYVFDQQSLEVLLLCENQIKLIPEQINRLNQLKSLDVSYNELGRLPDQLGQLRHLSNLSLGYNEITSLPVAIGELENLTHLNLHSNQLRALPTEIGQLTQLRRLDLGSETYTHQNQLKDLPLQIGQLRNLTRLDLSNNLLKELPAEFSQLQELRQLDLSGNLFTDSLEVLGQLQNLNQLNLGNNELSNLPYTLGQLQNLRSLDIRSNQFEVLPEIIFQLPKLTQLYIGENKLNALLPTIGQLINLIYLDAGGNPFASATTVSLEQLPPEIGELEKLESLHLSFNKLSKLPTEIGQLRELRWLYLRANLLEELPLTVGQLQYLYLLDLRSNKLTKLPDEITQLQNLSSLDLSANQLSDLPENIVKMKSLKQLWLTGNPIPVEEIEALRLAMPWCEIKF